ncbi:CorA family divalent cation transporter [Cognatilysobacter segetis]|uniref:CorA family divalent cation transporter n=1 Tax=Cognatilysobacter segetis TaxID=2492394 RepID=UPI00105FA162|nr:CorA family divalent cation transporter [Lysobacter segetis]
MPDRTEPRSTETGPTPQPPLRALLFDTDQVSREVDASALDAYARVPDHRLLWVNALVEAGLPDMLTPLGADVRRLDPDEGGELGLVIHGDWTYLHVRALNWHGGGKPAQVPVAIGIGPNVVVTVHRAPVDFLASVLNNEADHLRIGGLEATSFAMGLLDRMLTDFLDARDAFETSLDRLELMILRRPQPRHLGELQALRHMASRLRRYLAAQRDLFDALGRPDFDPRLSDAAERHCRALSGRYGDVMLAIEAARELVNGSFDLYTSRTAESTNQAMHTLTVVTVVMGFAATVAGVLGMNFQARLFDTGERGFVAAAGLIAALVLGSGAWALWRLLRSQR